MKRNIFWKIIIIVFAINVGILDVYLLLIKDKIDFKMTFDILALIELFIITINVAIFAMFYFRDDKKGEKKEKSDIKRYWYHEVLLSDKIQLVSKLFSLCLMKNRDNSIYESVENIKEDLQQIVECVDEVRREICRPIAIISPELSEELNGLIMTFDEEFAVKYSDRRVKNTDESIELVTEYIDVNSNQFLNKLYAYDML